MHVTFQKKFMTILLATVSASGCALRPTTPTENAIATRASDDRILAFQESTAIESATLIIVRDSGLLGSGCYYSIWINGVHAARLSSGEKASFFLKPGEHVLRSGRDLQGRGLCSFGLDEWTQRETTLRESEVKSFRMLIDKNGKTDLQRN